MDPVRIPDSASSPSVSIRPPLLERLGRETACLHAEVEASVAILSPAVTLLDYQSFLTMLWGFHRPIEERLASVPGLEGVVPDMSERWKSALLERDLASFDVSTASIRTAERWPVIDRADRALGALYVVEGSTLGGVHIHRHLERVLPTALARASRFLGCYGSRTGRMWSSFREHLVRGARREDDVVGAACETFEAVRDWFSMARPQEGRRGEADGLR